MSGKEVDVFGSGGDESGVFGERWRGFVRDCYLLIGLCLCVWWLMFCCMSWVGGIEELRLLLIS